MNASGLTPLEFFVIVELDVQAEKTAGGIYLPPQAKDADELSTQEGTLVAASPHAFTYADGWPEGSKPQAGQRVLFKKFAGATARTRRAQVSHSQRQGSGGDHRRAHRTTKGRMMNQIVARNHIAITPSDSTVIYADALYRGKPLVSNRWKPGDI
jgi:co-chaperonin GroES (HSP10)